MKNQDFNRVFLSKMPERITQMNMIDLPKFTGVDEKTLRELCSELAMANEQRL